MSKAKKSLEDKEKAMIEKSNDLEKKGKLDHSVDPPWPINDKKGKSGAWDRGHRNRP